MSSASRSGDWRRRADAVRDLPLDAILQRRGASRSVHDKSKWHTERGSLSVTECKFTNWCCQVGCGPVGGGGTSGGSTCSGGGQVGGGGAIDLVMHLADVNFREAVEWLEWQFGICPTGLSDVPPLRSQPSSSQPLARQLLLPAPDPRQLVRVQRYLTQDRYLSNSSLEPLIASGKIYADHRGNAVFLLVAGKAQRPIGAELRGTGPRVWRGLAPGTDKNRGFFWTGETGSRTIVLCESAIDAISCRELLPEYLAISTSGARPCPCWLSGLVARDYTIHCGYDTDTAGEGAAARMIALHPTIQRFPPPAHDWNDALQAAHRSSCK